MRVASGVRLSRQVSTVTSADVTAKDRMRVLERANAALKPPNEILKAASMFFATELDGRAGARRST